MLAVVFMFDLHDIVGQMNMPFFEPGRLLLAELIFEFFSQGISALNLGDKRKFLTAGPNVAFTVPVGLKTAIDAGQQHVVPDVKLSLIVK